MKKAVVLVSGGIDSSTCCAIASHEGYSIYAMSFMYGQRHSIEIESARRIAEAFRAIDHRIVHIDLRAFGGSSLTSNIEVPKDRTTDNENVIPSTYVPARNTINCFDIFIGVNAIDYSGYPDCRPEFISAYQTMANLATKNGVEGKKLIIHTPLISLSKSAIIKQGAELGVDYSLTHSCYDPDISGNACGRCDSCIIRRKGFEVAGIPDPTRYTI
jgi:7-cyano-7-deazaguanine synthase